MNENENERVLLVARLGHPIVRSPAASLDPAQIVSEPVQRLIDQMAATMRAYDGVGIAGTQVHAALRIALIEVRGAQPRYPRAPEIPLTVLINPEIVERSAETVEDWEGCLSVPGLRGLVPRARALKVRALDRSGEPVELEVEDFFARVVQHECDHLEGKVYLDRMADLRTLSFQEEFLKYGKNQPPR